MSLQIENIAAAFSPCHHLTSQSGNIGSGNPELPFLKASRRELQNILDSDQGENVQKILCSLTELRCPDERTLELMQFITLVAKTLSCVPETSSRIPPNILTEMADTHFELSTSNVLHQDSTSVVYKGAYKNCVAHFKEYRSLATQETDVKRLALCQALLRLCFAGPGLLPTAGVWQPSQAFDRKAFLVELPPEGYRDLTNYLTQTPDTNRLLLLRDIAEPLERFHANGVVLGPVTKKGVAVASTGRAYLSNLDYLRLDDPTTKFVPLVTCLDTIRRLPPEVIRPAMEGEDGDGDFAPLTKGSDVYSLGCFIFELFTGRPPFAEYTKYPRHFSTLLADVTNGQSLQRPAEDHTQRNNLTDEAWTLIGRCCALNPEDRPSISDLLQHPLLKDLRDDRPTH